MIALKKNNHIDETKLDRNESILFIGMLRQELTRHECESYRAKELMYFDVGHINAVFWQCQMENHKQDMLKIKKCIDYLVDKWG